MTKKNVTQNSPLKQVKDTYGDKASLISELAGKLDRQDGENKGDLQKRLAKVSSKKLLTLAKRLNEVDGIGGRDGMINALHDAHMRAITKKGDFKDDKNYRTYLGKKSTGALLDLYKAMQKKTHATAN